MPSDFAGIARPSAGVGGVGSRRLSRGGRSRRHAEAARLTRPAAPEAIVSCDARRPRAGCAIVSCDDVAGIEAGVPQLTVTDRRNSLLSRHWLEPVHVERDCGDSPEV